MNPAEVERLKAALPNDYYYDAGNDSRRQGLYCSDEHDLVLHIPGSQDAPTVIAALLKQARDRGRDEGKAQVYRQLAEAIGMDNEVKALREEMTDMQERLERMIRAATN